MARSCRSWSVPFKDFQASGPRCPISAHLPDRLPMPLHGQRGREPQSLAVVFVRPNHILRHECCGCRWRSQIRGFSQLSWAPPVFPMPLLLFVGSVGPKDRHTRPASVPLHRLGLHRQHVSCPSHPGESSPNVPSSPRSPLPLTLSPPGAHPQFLATPEVAFPSVSQDRSRHAHSAVSALWDAAALNSSQNA